MQGETKLTNAEYGLEVVITSNLTGTRAAFRDTDADELIGAKSWPILSFDSITALKLATAWAAEVLNIPVEGNAMDETKYTVINLDTDEEHGSYDTMEQARGAVAYDRLRAYAIWHNDQRVQSCDPYYGTDERALQGMGEL